MTKLAKQISIVDLAAEAIQEPSNPNAGGVGYTYVESEVKSEECDSNPFCRFSLKLSSPVNDSWKFIFKEKCSRTFPKKSAPNQFGIGRTHADESGKIIESKPEKNSGPCDWLWEVSPDEKVSDVIYAKTLLADAELLLEKLKVVISDTQKEAIALELLIEKQISPLREKLKRM